MGQHAVDVTATGSVDTCTWVRIEASFWLTDYNTKRLADVTWTKGKSEQKAGPDFGWTIDWPEYLAGDQYQHHITIANDDTTEALVLKELKFYAAMDSIEDLETISFPIVLPDVVALAPGESWVYDLVTTGDLVGGHIYGHFTIQGVADTTDMCEDIFDHPITERTRVSSHTQWGLIILILVVAGFFVYMIMTKRRAVISAR